MAEGRTLDRTWRFLGATIGAVLTLASGCEFPVSDPPAPGAVPAAEERGEQAEVDATVAQTPTGARTLVAGYRYTGGNPLFNDPTQGMDIEYASDGTRTVTVHRFASIAGWSHSESGGLVWSAPGKIYPPTVATGPGDAMAIYWGDPALASGDITKSLVAYSFLGGSKSLFDSKVETGDVVNHWPATDLVDAICVAISTDGGATFPNHAICKVPPGSRANGTDQTSVAIAQDKVFVTTTNLDTNELLLFQVDPITGFSSLRIDGNMSNAILTPRLRRDNHGRLWLAAATSSGETKMCLVQPASDLPGSCFFAGSITRRSCPYPVIGSSATIGPVRTGETFDFGAWHNSPDALGGTTEFTFAYHTGCPSGALHIGVTRCTWKRGSSPALQFTDFKCTDVTTWGTQSLPGQQFQPRIEVVDLGTSPTSSDVRYAFYQVDGGSVAADHVRVTRSSRLTFPTTSPTFERLETLGTPVRDPKVCPADYGPGIGTTLYWGDFFAFRMLMPVGAETKPSHVAIYSSDEGRGCVTPQPSLWQGRNLHVVSGTWTD